MSKLLIPFDGSEKSRHAVITAIEWVRKSREPVSVYLLNVQSPITFADIKKYVTEEALQAYYSKEGNRVLMSACDLLLEAEIPHDILIGVGQIAETIDQYAREMDCDHIIMGTRGLGSISGLILGSIATKVIQLVEVPITLVK